MRRLDFALAAGVLLCAAAPAAWAPAWADDSSAALKAGGLVFTKQAHIRMAREDLYISPTRVKVRYAFVNDGKTDVDTIVAFPLPDIDVREFYYEPLGTTLDASPNFMGFKLTVDGKPVEATADARAVLDGKDVTDKVKAAGLPLNIVGTKLVDMLEKMPLAARKKFAAQGILEMDGDDAHPHWIAKTSFWWHQKFPAGKTVVIGHEYQPVTGQFFFGENDLTAKEPGYAKYYCIDGGTQAAIRAKIRKLDPMGANGRYLQGTQTEFVLKTANNWKGGIGQFRLTLDKLKPDNALSLCWDGALKKTGATTFEAARDGFAPARDVKLLVLQ
ncbi:MAG: DUF4424 family protein [Alphaproteobacteria bacterium]|nr:DUF4424 family protein [Alphaproteobacteria bacterium]